ncbi:oxygen-independent coproporphyrinogen III oxidase [Alteromonas pelagimontana]|uniref:Coproporphyrinogen-III oxidase n=1 Tax=Alteromonas pelagimontana TaxID=1858656 RepID=A0A6M4MJS9_9ALTE|nr:oxygen-independent coproporphyrinogen III oxidase [Alteromonas pelagimontana]QJR82346.1 oxygen-independent coproporphyrinogen III oxidase [Alteromonas pelagimontana]
MPAIDLFNPAILSKYNIQGPRYTSYPTALEFRSDVQDGDLARAAENSTATGLSLYIHIPFCHSMCFYCGCNKIVTRQQDKADRYLDYLEKEIVLRSKLFRYRKVSQLHLGGGTPSFLTLAQQHRLMTVLQKHFHFAAKTQCSIEVDPRRIDKNYIKALYALGYNRLSIGVQDTDYRVQAAINRVQSTAHIADLAEQARNEGFNSINLDIIYGLPHQTPETFTTTLAAVKAIAPERVSLFGYAHLPSKFAAQRKIKDVWLGDGAARTELMKLATQRLTRAGYRIIGMDHFALQHDELAIAQTNGTLHRNFQGYTTRGDLDLLGLGVSSISSIANLYVQNPTDLSNYYGALDSASTLVSRGIELTEDDQIRRTIITQLMCHLRADFSVLNSQFGIRASDYFKQELISLQTFVDDGLVEVTAQGIVVHPHARLLIRIICMTFDAYLQQSVQFHRYSKVI